MNSINISLSTDSLPTLPTQVILSDNNTYQLVQNLRFLPGKRWVVLAKRDETFYVLKFFPNEKYIKRETAGNKALASANIPHPNILFHGVNAKGLYFFCYQYIENANTFAHCYKHLNTQQLINTSRLCLQYIKQLHDSGYTQDDIHLGNFFVDINGTQLTQNSSPLAKVWMLDSADIKPIYKERLAINNLAKFLAQFPCYFDTYHKRVLDAYFHHPIDIQTQQYQILLEKIYAWRLWRIKKYLQKSIRNSSEFCVKKTWRSYSIYRKSFYFPQLQSLLADTDRFINEDNIIKAGDTSTVAKFYSDSYSIIIKRYNIKGPIHYLRRCLRPSRAIKSWKNALMLETVGINTSTAIAFKEVRYGFLRSKAYFFMLEAGEKTLLDAVTSVEDAQQVAPHISQLFKFFSHLKISHGDFKYTNFIYQNDTLSIIDLDSMKRHFHLSRFSRAHTKDKMRFLKNWKNKPDIYQYFSSQIMPLKDTKI